MNASWKMQIMVTQVDFGANWRSGAAVVVGGAETELEIMSTKSKFNGIHRCWMFYVRCMHARVSQIESDEHFWSPTE